MDQPPERLNRFTTIPFLIDLLTRKKLTLLNPSFWEDYNDKKTLSIYRKAIEKKSVYALCLSYDSETIHHWNAFANGSGGCCIGFNASRLLYILDAKGIKHAATSYIRVRDLPKTKVTLEELPFVKRARYKPECEYRIIATSDEPQKASLDIDIDLDTIEKISLSSRIPRGVYESLVATLKQVDKNFTARFHQSTLLSNAKWVSHFKESFGQTRPETF
jgi:hypothetical protein